MLIVIAIMGILMALTAGAVFKFILVQQSKNTQGTIKTLEAARQDRWNAALADAERNSSSIATQHGAAAANAISAMAGGDSKRAEGDLYLLLSETAVSY